MRALGHRAAALPPACLLAACLLLFACGAKSDLTQDDFYVWQDGGAVYTPAEFNGQDFLFAYTDKFNRALISTKRGVRLGDEATKVAEAYAGTPCSIYRGAFTNEEYEAFANVKDYALVMPKLTEYPDYWVIYELWLVDGRIRFDGQNILRSIDEKRLHDYEQCQWYELTYTINGGTVQGIRLSMMDFVEDEILG